MDETMVKVGRSRSDQGVPGRWLGGSGWWLGRPQGSLQPDPRRRVVAEQVGIANVAPDHGDAAVAGLPHDGAL